jgi:hypothetical protein
MGGGDRSAEKGGRGLGRRPGQDIGGQRTGRASMRPVNSGEGDAGLLVIDGDGECRERRVVGARHSGEDFTRARFTDVDLVRCDLSGCDFGEATWERVRLVDCRASAIELPLTKMRSVAFVDCKLDDANLRMARLREVRFENCVLSGAELLAAHLDDVSFGGSDLAGVDFTQARCAGVDLRDARLSGIKGIDALRGAIVALEQVVTLAPALALALGLRVHTEDEPVLLPAPVAGPRVDGNDRRDEPPRS